MAKIEKLTPEQEKLLVEFRTKWLKIGISTSPADKKRAEAAITEMYKLINKATPKFEWVTSPAEAIKKLGKKAIGQEWWGQHESYWIAFYLFCRDVLGVKYDDDKSKQLDLWRDIAESCGWWWPYEDVCVISDRPQVCTLDERGRIHNDTGKCVEYRDEWGIYAVHGVRLDNAHAYVVTNPEKITVKAITAEQNAEIRRIMLDRFGADRYIRESEAKLVNKDEFGELYQTQLAGDESLTMVRVFNSTPEQDGSRKEYWLRVDPNAYGGLKTARAAVASTWRNNDGSMLFKKPEDYNPAVET